VRTNFWQSCLWSWETRAAYCVCVEVKSVQLQYCSDNRRSHLWSVQLLVLCCWVRRQQWLTIGNLFPLHQCVAVSEWELLDGGDWSECSLYAMSNSYHALLEWACHLSQATVKWQWVPDWRSTNVQWYIECSVSVICTDWRSAVGCIAHYEQDLSRTSHHNYSQKLHECETSMTDNDVSC